MLYNALYRFTMPYNRLAMLCNGLDQVDLPSGFSQWVYNLRHLLGISHPN